MRPRSLATLAIIVALFGAYLYFVERKRPTTDERAARAQRVMDVDAAEVEALTLTYGDVSVRLERLAGAATDEDGGAEEPAWHLRQPMVARADDTAVADLVRDLIELEKSRTLEDFDRAAAGFDPPRATVTLTRAAGDVVLDIGPAVPASDAMLVAVSGRPEVFQVPDALWSTLTQPAGAWRDRQVFAFDRGAIERLRLVPATGDADAVLLAKRGPDFWLESPIVDRADAQLINGLIGTLTTLQVDTFLDPSDAERDATLADHGLAPAHGRIEIVLTDRTEPSVIEIGNVGDTEGSIHARVGAQAFSADAAPLRAAIERAADAWRDHAWTAWQVFDIERATIAEAAGAGTVTLERDDGEWQRDGEPIDYTAASDVLYALVDLRAETVVDRATLDPTLLAVPVATVELGGEDERKERLTLFADGERTLATTDGRDAILVMATAALDDWRAKLTALRAAVPQRDEAPPGDAETTEESTVESTDG